MSWGVETFLVDYVTSTDAMVRQVDSAILSIGRFKAGDTVVIGAGSPPRTSGSTNLAEQARLAALVARSLNLEPSLHASMRASAM
jgi:pyruvate kinase